MLNNILETLYYKVIVSIVIKKTSTDIYAEMYGKKGVLQNKQKNFDSTFLTAEMLNFIYSYTKETPYHYISVLDNATKQGAFPTCEKNRLAYFYDVSASEYKCYGGSWTYYTSKTDLYAIEKNYFKIGVDLVFSPFVLLSNFFKDKIDSNFAIYILLQENSIALAVFKQGKLLFAEYIDTDIESMQEPQEILSSLSMEEDIDLDMDVDLEEIDVIDNLDDFGDIEDLDSLEDIDQFSNNQDIEEEFFEAQESVNESSGSEEGYNADFQKFNSIQGSIGRYYADDRYEREFLETVYIANATGASGDLKQYLEEEMFLNVYIRQVELGMELSSLAKMELKR